MSEQADRISPDRHTTGRRRDIQGLRAVAVLAVVLFHARIPGFDGGFVGVDVFFVISGFVIGRSLYREFDSTGTIVLRRFFARRVRRLAPAFSAATLGGLLLTTLVLELGEIQRIAASTAFSAALSVSNIHLYLTGGQYFSPAAERNPFLHTWSLGVEEQFYLVAPGLVLVLALAARSTRWRRRSVVVAGIGVLSLGSLWYNLSLVAGSAQRLAFYSPVSRFWEIGLGLVLAAFGSVTGRRAGVLTALGVGGLAFAVFTYDDATAYPGSAAMIPVAATALLILAPAPGATGRLLEHDIAVWIGDRSYSWYLWHWPLIVTVGFAYGESPVLLAAAALASLGLAAATFSLVERPMMSSSPRPERGRRVLVAAGLAVALTLTASSVVRAGAERRWGFDIQPLTIDNVSHRERCHGTLSEVPDTCTFAPRGQRHGTVLLFGDSHAASLSDGVIEAANRLGYTVTTVSYDNCPFFEVRTTTWCADYRELAWELVERTDPAVVLVAHSTAGYVRADDGSKQLRDDAGAEVIDEDEALAVWLEGLSVTRARVRAHGAVLVSLDLYPHSTASFDGVPTLFSPSRKDRALPLADLALERDWLIDAEHSRLANGAWIDVAPAFCDSSGCRSTDSDGTWLYFDGGHLNRAGSLHASGILEDELRRILRQWGRQVADG